MRKGRFGEFDALREAVAEAVEHRRKDHLTFTVLSLAFTPLLLFAFAAVPLLIEPDLLLVFGDVFFDEGVEGILGRLAGLMAFFVVIFFILLTAYVQLKFRDHYPLQRNLGLAGATVPMALFAAITFRTDLPATHGWLFALLFYVLLTACVCLVGYAYGPDELHEDLEPMPFVGTLLGNYARIVQQWNMVRPIDPSVVTHAAVLLVSTAGLELEGTPRRASPSLGILADRLLTWMEWVEVDGGTRKPTFKAREFLGLR